MNVDWLLFFRTMEILTSSVVVVLVFIRGTKNWKDFSAAQKLLLFSWTAFMITSTWDVWNLIVDNDDFSLRAIPFMIGITCAIAYLLEPSRSYRKRLGKDPLGKAE